MTSTYYLHPIKCMKCSLHFIVCSDYENWPLEGTTSRIQRDATPNEQDEEPPQIHCPECGNTGPAGFNLKMLHYPAVETTGFIFQAVPGMSGFKPGHRIQEFKENEHG